MISPSETAKTTLKEQANYQQAFYQPTYPSSVQLEKAQAELRTMEGIASTESIQSLSSEFADISMGRSTKQIITLGRCVTDISMGKDVQEITSEVMAHEELVGQTYGALGIFVTRTVGQHVKPRSKAFEKVRIRGKDVYVPSWYGPAINGSNPTDREPNPVRAVESAIQSRAVMESLEARGSSPYTAREALLMPFENSFTRQRGDGSMESRSAHMPWVGVRTNSVQSPQMKRLATLENPVGVKIDSSSTPDDIEAIYRTLNPRGKDLPGKITYILRFGIENIAKMQSVIVAITDRAPGSLMTLDPMHGNTYEVEKGVKTRALEDMEREIEAFVVLSRQFGNGPNGIHLEANGLENRFECVRKRGEIPKHRSTIDPELNIHQTRQLLMKYKYLIMNS